MSLLLRPLLPASGLALVSLLGACGDSSGPSEAAIDDPQGLVTSMKGMVGTLTNGPLVGVENVAEFGAGALGRAFPGSRVAVGRGASGRIPSDDGAGGPVEPAVREMGPRSPRIWAAAYSAPWATRSTTGSMATSTSSIPLPGNTKTTVPTRGRSTACASSFTTWWQEPWIQDQVGTLDVEDLSDAETFQVSVRVTGMAQETYADYTVTLPDNGVPISNGFDLVAEGILSRGADPMDFNLHFAQINARNQSVKLDLVGPVENLHFDFVDTFNPISENSHTAIDVLLNKGIESVRLAGFQDFDGGSRLYTTDLTLRGNGQIFATATRDDGGFPVWEKASGEELTQDEQILIGTLLSGVFDSVFHSLGLMLFVLLMVA